MREESGRRHGPRRGGREDLPRLRGPGPRRGRGGGADEAQLAILDEVLSANEVTLEQAQLALDDYGVCLDGAGLALSGVTVIDEAGFKRLDYRIQAGEDTTVMDACYAKTFQWVDMLYQTQPAATQAQDVAFEEALPELIACLQEGGVPIDSGAPADEVKNAMSTFFNEHMPKAGDPGATQNDDGSLSWSENPPGLDVVPECLGRVGINGY